MKTTESGLPLPGKLDGAIVRRAKKAQLSTLAIITAVGDRWAKGLFGRGDNPMMEKARMPEIPTAPVIIYKHKRRAADGRKRNLRHLRFHVNGANRKTVAKRAVERKLLHPNKKELYQGQFDMVQAPEAN